MMGTIGCVETSGNQLPNYALKHPATNLVSSSHVTGFRLETAVLFMSDGLLVTTLGCMVILHMFFITLYAVLHCSLYLLVYYVVNLKNFSTHHVQGCWNCCFLAVKVSPCC